jgi:pectate lyase
MGTDHTKSQIFFHGVNNYFQNVGGHAFDIDTNTWVLLEGNYFENVNTPLTQTSLKAGGKLYTTSTVNAAGACRNQLGYICEWNRLAGSGAWQDRTDADVLSKAATFKTSLVGHYAVADVPAKVVANAGVGKV